MLAGTLGRGERGTGAEGRKVPSSKVVVVVLLVPAVAVHETAGSS